MKSRIRAGLCSVTFRSLTPPEIISACVENQLEGIEWGGDVHAPHGDLRACAEIRQRCSDANIDLPSYGSYFRLDPASSQPSFGAVLDSAVALGARTIRVWGGDRASCDIDPAYREALVTEARKAGDDALAAGCQIGIEYHDNTITDSNASARDFISEVNHPAVRIYWQPRPNTPPTDRLGGLRMILPWLCHLHVYQWIGEQVDRRPLAEGTGEWEIYLREAAVAANSETFAFLEFVRGNSLDSMQSDAVVLRRLVSRQSITASIESIPS